MNRSHIFLRCYSRTGSITRAAEAADIHRSIHYRRLKEDAAYAKAFAKVDEEAKEFLAQRALDRIVDAEEALFTRAVDGWEEPVTYQGEFSYEPKYDQDGNVLRGEDGKPVRGKMVTVRKFSDSNLQFFLRGARPEKYRERFNHTGVVTHEHKFKGTLEQLIATYRALTTEEDDEEGAAAAG